MEYVLGVVVGVIFGVAVGAGKYFFLWRKLLNPEYKPDKNETAKLLYRNMIASYIINIAALLVIFFLRNIMPFDFAATIIAAALALSLANRIFPINKAMRAVGEQNNANI